MGASAPLAHSMRPGLLLVHKPLGATSFSVLREVTAELEKQPGPRLPLCHGGTLDPFAEGLLLVLVGPLTKAMNLLHAVPKTYLGQVAWGAETDNGDPLGTVVFRGDPTALTETQLDAALAPHLGWTDQVPPPTSAKKLGGEPAYRKVHRGETVVLPPSRVYLHRARWVSHQLPVDSQLSLQCRGGYYVRALVRDVGRQLGCGAHLTRLHRTLIGPWEDPGPGKQVWLRGVAQLPWCGSRVLTDPEWASLKRGAVVSRGTVRGPAWQLPAGFPDPDAPVLGMRGESLVGLLALEGGGLRLQLPFSGGA